MMNSTGATLDVLVAGAGPVGLMLASGLARRGTGCRLIDKLPAPSPESRALAIFPRTLEVFESIGVIDSVLELGHRIDHIAVYSEGRQIALVSISEVPSPYPFVVSLPEQETERILTSHLARFGIEVERESSLAGFTQDETGVVATLDSQGRNRACTASYLVGCDGARSTVRHALNIPFKGAAYDETFVLADVKLTGRRHDDEISLYLHRDGILIFIPMPGGKFRVVADLAPDSNRQIAVRPTPAEIQELVEHRGPGGVIVSDPSWISTFNISRRKAERFSQGRVFLAGDAAHIHSPAGGQGMNTGIQDAHNLAWKLTLVASHQSPENLLDSYDAEREPVAAGVLEFTDQFTKMATLHNRVAQGIRDLALHLLASLPRFEQNLAERLAELAVSYHDSPIVEEHGDGLPGLHGDGPVAGDRAPDGWVVKRRGESVRLFQILRDTRHVLLLFAGAAPVANEMRKLDALSKTIQAAYQRQIAVHLVVRSEDNLEQVDSGAALIDIEGRLHQGYQVQGPCLYLIRPDGYIAFHSNSMAAEPLEDYLKRIFRPTV